MIIYEVIEEKTGRKLGQIYLPQGFSNQQFSDAVDEIAKQKNLTFFDVKTIRIQ